MWFIILIASFRYDVSVMILLRISILGKIITETSYPKLTIKPHKLHYKYLLAYTVEYHIWNSQSLQTYMALLMDFNFKL